MKHKEKCLNNIEAEKVIKNILIELRYKCGEMSSIIRLKAMLYYIESHEIACEYIDALKNYLKYLENKGVLYHQDDWEWFLRHFMAIVRGHLTNPSIEEWEKFDLNLLVSKVI